MKKSNISVLNKIGFGFTGTGIIFVYSLAAAACCSLNIWYALVTSVICLILSIPLKNEVLAPDSFLLVPVIFTVCSEGGQFLPLTVVSGAIIYLILKLIFKKITVNSCVIAGASLGLAFSATVLFTTLYFGIGATGATVPEMLKNYRYLGFHPNWRGVFYGTITLFAMITYPFKFRKLNKYLPAEVFSLAIPFIFNLFLNPNAETTPILETGSLSKVFESFDSGQAIPFINADFDADAILLSLKSGFAVALILLAYKASRKDGITVTTSNILSGLGGGFPSRCYSIRGYSPVSAVSGIILVCALTFLCPSFIARIPIHSLAVVLIVSGWQNVPFSLVAQSFKEKGILEITAVLLIFASFVFFDVFIALIVCVFFAVSVRRIRRG